MNEVFWMYEGNSVLKAAVLHLRICQRRNTNIERKDEGVKENCRDEALSYE